MSKVIQCLEFTESKEPSGYYSIDSCFSPAKYFVEYISQAGRKPKKEKKHVCGRHMRQIERYCIRMNKLFEEDVSKFKAEKLIPIKPIKQ